MGHIVNVFLWLICASSLLTVIITTFELGDRIVTIKNPDVEKGGRKRFAIAMGISFLMLQISYRALSERYGFSIDPRAVVCLIGAGWAIIFLFSACFPHNKK